jgi:menaquinone reductase, molybdopterin-binding-like subunit
MKKIGRKEFLKIGAGAIAGGVAGTIFSGAPLKGLQWLTERTQNMIKPAKGPEHYLKTICTACKDKCELSIRMTGQRAVNIESSNTGCPIGQNALQLLYHPERIDTPLKRTGRKGSVSLSDFEKVDWDTALHDIALKINTLIENNQSDLIAGISRQKNLQSALLNKLINTAGSPHFYYEPSLDSLSESALGGCIEYNFLNSDFILSFGARLFEGWGNPASINSSLIKLKKKGTRIIQIDSICTRTASMTEWINIKPGTELFLAMGIANYMLTVKGRSSGNNKMDALIRNFSIDKSEALSGVPLEKIKDIADAFYSSLRPVAVAGRGGKAVSSSYSEFAVIHAINVMSGMKSCKIKSYAYQNFNNKSGLERFITDKNFAMMFINGADPVYSSPAGDMLSLKLKKAFVVEISPILNDTAMYADYILPPLTFIEEELKDKITIPAKARHAGDIIIDLAKKITVANQFTWIDYNDAVKNSHLKETAINPVYNINVIHDQLAMLEKETRKSPIYPFSLLPVELTFMNGGDGMAFPYILKTIDTKTYSKKLLHISMNRDTAAEYGITEGRMISIESSRGKTKRVKVHLTDIIPPYTIAAPIGFGHMAYTRYAAEKGFNFKRVMNDKIDPVTGAADWWHTKVRIQV